MHSDGTPDPSDSHSSPGSQDIQKAKKRRLHGACDTCRKKKVKCDSAEMPGNVCTNCRVANVQCSHDIPRQPKKSETQQAYIHNLEEKVAKMERYLQKIHPDQDIDRLIEFPFDDIPIHEPTRAASSSYPDLRYPIPQSASTNMSSPAPVSTPSDAPDDPDPSEADDLAHVALAEHLSTLSVTAIDDRFFGQSSAFMFTKEVSTVRSEITGAPSRPDPVRFRRPLYWDMKPWEMAFALTPEPTYVYPEEELMRSLVSLYFERMNSLFPILHKPSFLKSLSSGQHKWDATFGATVLQVCALGARYSKDSRVTVTNDASGLSSGWQYFCQVPVHRRSTLYKSTIYDLQYYCLATLYLIGSSMPHGSWNVLGLGMRYAVEKGAHRRRGHNQRPSVKEELLKRSFWCLVCIDRVMSSFLGRPGVIQDEEFDVEYPIECDDEYWETDDPEQAFQQPAGKPCSITGFVCFIKLCEILGFAIRTLYSTKKSKALVGLIGNEWESRIVAELDSSMNKWKDNLPYFLRWDPERADALFFHQSVSLHATYYYIQIQIHRPFLTKQSSLSFSSLAMCTNAARSCSHVLEAAVTRGLRIVPNLIMAAHAAGLVIVLNLWSNLRSGRDTTKETENLQKIITVLKECEKRWHSAGRMSDMLNEVGSIHEYQPTFNKRRRGSFSANDKEYQSASFASSPPAPIPTVISENSRNIPITSVNASAQSFSFDTAAAMPINDWDLSNLLLVEMGYIQPNLGENVEQQPFNIAGLPTDAEASPSLEYDETTLNKVMQEKNPLDFSMSDDIFALWSDIPATFSAGEWQTYLANLGQTQSIP